MTSFGSNYSTPGWQRAQANKTAAASPRGAPCYGRTTGVGRGTRSIYAQGRRRSAKPDRGGRSARRRRNRPPPAAHHRGRAGGEIDRRRVSFHVGDRVFHQKFGNGNVTVVDGNKLTIAFDRAGEKRVVNSFVERV